MLPFILLSRLSKIEPFFFLVTILGSPSIPASSAVRFIAYSSPVQEHQYLTTVFDLPVATILQHEANQFIHGAQVSRIMNFPLMPCRYQQTGSFQHCEMTRQGRRNDVLWLDPWHRLQCDRGTARRLGDREVDRVLDQRRIQTNTRPC